MSVQYKTEDGVAFISDELNYKELNKAIAAMRIVL